MVLFGWYDASGQLLSNSASIIATMSSDIFVYCVFIEDVAQPAVESRIAGTFEGWSGETVFLLDNGQLWEQSSYAYLYHYAYRPKVWITNTPSGYILKVEGVSSEIYVKYVQQYISSKIDGEFTGWTGSTLFPLQNGQIWQQNKYAYKYHYAWSPDVLIYLSLNGYYKMRVSGVADYVTVTRIN